MILFFILGYALFAIFAGLWLLTVTRAGHAIGIIEKQRDVERVKADHWQHQCADRQARIRALCIQLGECQRRNTALQALTKGEERRVKSEG